MSTMPVLNPPPEDTTAPWERADFDWSAWDLPDEEDMGQGGEQSECIHHLRDVLKQWRYERGKPQVYIGTDQFFKLHPTRTAAQISPDVYLLPDEPPSPMPASWALGSVEPLLAVEIVSDDKEWRKDYERNPPKYQLLKTKEFIIFDLEYLRKPHPRRTSPPRAGCTVYRANEQGRLILVDQGPGPFYSKVLDAWWVILPFKNSFRLGLARDSHGLDLIPPRDESEHQRAEAEHQRAEAERLRAEQAEHSQDAMLTQLAEHRLGRPLEERERQGLRARRLELGAQPAMAALLALDAQTLPRWLTASP